MRKVILACIALFLAINLDASEGFYRLEKPINESEYQIKSHHKQVGIKCENCHDMSQKEANLVGKASTATCLSCHKSYEQLASLSAHLGYDDNPHASPHYPDMDCKLCHASHKKSQNYCVMCHSQESLKNLIVP
ncbi:cytochrome c3 family protein [Campylobacter sp. 19-13652]|uniref:cytochrome c3 family protein n=1 Tax=Campylobacter sp. 19-13652 TaxID=2840180 RepID=UPI001C783A4C|nr:cytochrome c3 family protein [Campylobacter sp. 19-13652]BCX78765.1 hypothetical protein LBC_02270 [Campylobacter sp. 19-13652]